MGWMAWRSVLGSDSETFDPSDIQTPLGPIQPPHSMGTGGSFLRVQQPGQENDHAPPSSTDVKNEWRDISTPHICPHSMPMDNLIFIAQKSIHTIM